MHQWAIWSSPLCPCCGSVPETTLHHLLGCESPPLVTARTQGIAHLISWCQMWETHPCLIRLIASFCDILPNLSSSPVAPADPTLPPAVLLLYAQQLTLGPENFWFGRLVKQWEALQEGHYRSISHQRSSRAWAAGLTGRVLDISRAAWDARNAIASSSCRYSPRHGHSGCSGPYPGNPVSVCPGIFDSPSCGSSIGYLSAG